MPAAAVVERDNLAVIRGELVRAHAEYPSERTAQANKESAGHARPGGRAGQRRARTVVTGVPPQGCLITADGRKGPGPSHPDLGAGTGLLGESWRLRQPDRPRRLRPRRPL